jgi:hypothetical protein
MTPTIIKKGIIYIWKKIWSPIHPDDGEFAPIGQVIPLNKDEINKFDDLQGRYIGSLDGSNSANYISDIIIYDRTLRMLKREDLSASERLFLIDILMKFKIYLENND